jgi:hypothetical protein
MASCLGLARADGSVRAVSQLLRTLALGAAVGSAAAAGPLHVGPVRPGYLPAYPLIYPGYLHPGACVYAGGCVGTMWDERRLRRLPVAPSEPAPVEQDIWGSDGSPWGYVRRLPPPTPEAQIQPQYRDASTIRPEFGGPGAGGPLVPQR